MDVIKSLFLKGSLINISLKHVMASFLVFKFSTLLILSSVVVGLEPQPPHFHV